MSTNFLYTNDKEEKSDEQEWRWCLVSNIVGEYVCNFRLQKVFKPVILKQMNQSKWKWRGNTDSDQDELIRALEWLNPSEAEKTKDKII